MFIAVGSYWTYSHSFAESGSPHFPFNPDRRNFCPQYSPLRSLVKVTNHPYDPIFEGHLSDLKLLDLSVTLDILTTFFFLKLGLNFDSQNLCDTALSWFPLTFLAIFSQSDFLVPPPLINLSQDFPEFNSLPSLSCVLSSQVISSLFHSFKYYLYAFNRPIYICNPELSSELQDEYPHLNVSQASQTKYMQNRILHIPQKPAYPPIFLRK